MPEGLTTTAGGVVKNTSSRDADNNIIVYWTGPLVRYGEATSLPSDAAICWLYVSDLSRWTQSYHLGKKYRPEDPRRSPNRVREVLWTLVSC